MEADTLDRLQRLTKLYRRGYRSPVIDQALGKLVVLEVEQCRIELQRLKARLVTSEQVDGSYATADVQAMGQCLALS